MRYKDIPQFTGWGRYAVDIELDRVPHNIKQYQEDQNLQLIPDFQRGHVWTREQQVAYIEFLLKGGRSGRDILFNHPGWRFGDYQKDFVLVDGLQRITAVTAYLNNDLPIFGAPAHRTHATSRVTTPRTKYGASRFIWTRNLIHPRRLSPSPLVLWLLSSKCLSRR